MEVDLTQDGSPWLQGMNLHNLSSCHSLGFALGQSCFRAILLCLILYCIASPTSSPFICWQTTHGSVPHTTTVQLSYVLVCSTNNKLHIPVKAQPSTRNTRPQSPAMLCMRPGPTQLIQSWPLWPFCCLYTQTCFHRQALSTTHS